MPPLEAEEPFFVNGPRKRRAHLERGFLRVGALR